ncbi:MAG TPA: type II CAAX endopeptidase family protein [Flavobacteriales bacterium]
MFPGQRFLSGLLLLAFSSLLRAQAPDTTFDHAALIEGMHRSEEVLFHRIADHYRTYIDAHPDDLRVRIEQCRFLRLARASEEGYTPDAEAYASCKAELEQAHGEEPLVRLFLLEDLWGEERVEALRRMEVDLRTDPAGWTEPQQLQVYRDLATDLYQLERYSEAHGYMQELCRRSAEDRGSLLRAQLLHLEGMTEEALDALNWNSDGEPWELQQRALLLLELGDADNAMHLFDVLARKDSTLLDKEALATALEEQGEFHRARYYRVSDTLNNWNALPALERLFEHDVRYGDPDTALVTYADLRDHGLMTDPLGLQRLRLFQHAPFLPWKGRDLLGPVVLLLLLIALCLAPYLLILPVHFVGVRWPARRGQAPEALPWGLRHAWWVIAGYLLATFFSIAGHPDLVLFYLTGEEDPGLPAPELAHVFLRFILFLALWTAPLLLRGGARALGASLVGFRRATGRSLLHFLGFRILSTALMRLFARVLQWMPEQVLAAHTWTSAVVREDIAALLTTYGNGVSILLIGLIVPIYEEIIFRGVLLGSFARYIGNAPANIVQSICFALVHDDLQQIPYFLLFGLLTGVLARRTGGLYAGIVFHAVNNVLAMLVIIARS